MMHLADPFEVFPDCRLWLAYFDDESDNPVSSEEKAHAEAKLSARDQRRWQQYRPAAKKRHFLNSRRAVRCVLQREFGDAAAHVQFGSDSQGCPVLVSQQIAHWPQVSLSHSGNAVAVVISTNAFPIGVDIEIVQPIRVEALRQVALNPHERAWCDQEADRESDALTTLWTIKEAVWKTLHCGGEIAMSEISVEIGHATLIPNVANTAFKDARFLAQLFVVACDPVVPETFCLMPGRFGSVALRGCVAQRIA